MSTMAATVRPRRAKFLEHFANRAACLVGMEACGGAQHWARRLRALGHEVRLLPAKIVRLLIHGARSVLINAKAPTAWRLQLAKRRPPNVVAVAIANKTARTMNSVCFNGVGQRGRRG